MSKNARPALEFLALAAAVPMLSACYTTRGAGKDPSAAGDRISLAADKDTNYKP